MKRAAIVVAAVALFAGAALGDSIVYLGQNPGNWYTYLFTTTDIDAGETVVFYNMEGVTGAQAASPENWSVSYTPLTTTYTWIGSDDSTGFFQLSLQSPAVPGTVQYDINTANGAQNQNITGPEYVPEPTTFALMGAGLMGMLGFVTFRKRKKG
jgi:membrane peptidoglycan carboxypeptidase